MVCRKLRRKRMPVNEEERGAALHLIVLVSMLRRLDYLGVREWRGAMRFSEGREQRDGALGCLGGDSRVAVAVAFCRDDAIVLVLLLDHVSASTLSAVLLSFVFCNDAFLDVWR